MKILTQLLKEKYKHKNATVFWCYSTTLLAKNTKYSIIQIGVFLHTKCYLKPPIGKMEINLWFWLWVIISILAKKPKVIFKAQSIKLYFRTLQYLRCTLELGMINNLLVKKKNWRFVQWKITEEVVLLVLDGWTTQVGRIWEHALLGWKWTCILRPIWNFQGEWGKLKLNNSDLFLSNLFLPFLIYSIVIAWNTLRVKRIYSIEGKS